MWFQLRGQDVIPKEVPIRDLDAMRKLIAAGQRADARRFELLLTSYMNDLREFAALSGQELILKRIDSLSRQIDTNQGQLLEGQQQMQQKQDLLLEKFNEPERRNAQTPVPSPSEIGQEVSEIRKELQRNADSAERAYGAGYQLLNEYRFGEAVPYLQEALAALPLPVFCLALGRAYLEIPDLVKAESMLRQGLASRGPTNDEKHRADIALFLSLTLQSKSDFDGALDYAQQALTIINLNNIAHVYFDTGDLKESLEYSERALSIDERVYGPEHPKVATDLRNMGMILQQVRDLEGALSCTQRALKIDEKTYGIEAPSSANDISNIGSILHDKGDLEGALDYSRRALKISERIYGPSHPNVAIVLNNIGAILASKGDLEGALDYSRRALKILEGTYGPDNPKTKAAAENVRQLELAERRKSADMWCSSCQPFQPLRPSADEGSRPRRFLSVANF